ncbi:hypothetical protein AWM75_06590 [Aerococcus urinaehominis]|uniref:Uncharacterized protein n=1 Tax=Aerococcus urinaehominis TaxID=128944 RepID=A0A120IB01_9LACT|nr:DivIVA domain-containing protein [Aerococcus urinaehominis]AMB99668.1 hypothetical protein AWM75_06590 [Aerococcus urinaehominis]SDL89652.1 cell division initiation protein [Aerococcus urinaehominis]
MKAKDLAKKEFKQKLSGYDKQEVKDYLQEVMRAMTNLEESNAYLQDQLYQANAELDDYHKKESALNRSIVVAQEAADQLRANALSEADTIIAQVEKEVESLLTQAAQKATNINYETNNLQEASRTFLHQMVAMTKGAQAMLADERWTHLFGPEGVEEVATPNLNEVLAQYNLPVYSDAAAVFQDQADQSRKHHETEAFFNNDRPAVSQAELASLNQEKDDQDQSSQAEATSQSLTSDQTTEELVDQKPLADDEAASLAPINLEEDTNQA